MLYVYLTLFFTASAWNIVNLADCGCENETLSCVAQNPAGIVCLGHDVSNIAFTKISNPTMAYFYAFLDANDRLPEVLATVHLWIVHIGIFVFPGMILGYILVNVVRAGPGQRWTQWLKTLGGKEMQASYLFASLLPLIFFIGVSMPSMAASTDETIPYVMFVIIIILDFVASSFVWHALGFSCCAMRDHIGNLRVVSAAETMRRTIMPKSRTRSDEPAFR